MLLFFVHIPFQDTAQLIVIRSGSVQNQQTGAGGGLNSLWKRLGIKPVRQATALNTLNKVMIINYLGGLLFALRYHQSF